MRKIQLFLLIILSSISYGTAKRENYEADANQLGKPPAENNVDQNGDGNSNADEPFDGHQVIDLVEAAWTVLLPQIQTAANQLSQSANNINQQQNGLIQRLIGAPRRALNGFTHLLLGPSE